MTKKSSLDDLRIDHDDVYSGSSRTARVVLWVFLGLVLLGVVAWFLLRERPPEVRTATATEVSVTGSETVLNATGYVTARRRATVSSKVTARVDDVRLEEGMAVNKGQILATLDASNIRASLNLADAQLSATRSSLAETRVQIDEANLELSRTQSLVRSNVISEAELDTARARVDTLKARLERQVEDEAVAGRQLDLWKQQLEDTIIRAPFAGVVVSKNAQPGEMISPISAGGGFTRTGIGTVVDMESLEIEVDVNEAYINRVKPDQPVVATLDSYPDWDIPAHVIAIVPTADRDRATVRVRIGFQSLDSRILPDMGVRVAFHSADEDDAAEPTSRVGVSVPSAALREDGGQDIVFVVQPDRTLERRAVRVLDPASDPVTISSGLNAGENVVVEGPAELADGDEVRELSP